MAIQITAINGMGSITESGGTYTTTGMEANDHMHISEDFILNAGVVSIIDDDFEVTQSDTPGKSVKVSSGRAYVYNSDYSIASLSEQKFWRCKSDVAEEVAISDNTSGNPRIDIICIKVDTTATPDDEATNVASLVVVEGTPAASPSIPSTPNKHLKLAEIAVANGFVSILDANITDVRPIVTFGSQSGDWKSPNATWTYASATTITVPAGATNIYQVGDKIKLTQTTVKYFSIVGVADTVLTITGGTSYTLTNATIVNPYYSKAENPQGFPQWFSYTPTYGANGSMTYTSVTTTISRFRISGKKCELQIRAVGTIGGTPSTNITITPPVNSANVYSSLAGACIYDGGSPRCTARVLFDNSASLISIGKYDGSTYTAGAGRDIFVNGSYEI